MGPPGRGHQQGRSDRCDRIGVRRPRAAGWLHAAERDRVDTRGASGISIGFALRHGDQLCARDAARHFPQHARRDAEAAGQNRSRFGQAPQKGARQTQLLEFRRRRHGSFRRRAVQADRDRHGSCALQRQAHARTDAVGPHNDVRSSTRSPEKVTRTPRSSCSTFSKFHPR